MRRSEHETTVTYDYENEMVRFYTTRKGEWPKLQRRLEPVWEDIEVTKHRNDEEVVAWNVQIPMDYCTNYMATLTNSANWLSK